MVVMLLELNEVSHEIPIYYCLIKCVFKTLYIYITKLLTPLHAIFITQTAIPEFLSSPSHPLHFAPQHSQQLNSNKYPFSKAVRMELDQYSINTLLSIPYSQAFSIAPQFSYCTLILI